MMNEWNREDLTSFLKKNPNGLLYFYTPLCGTCQVASKMLLVVEQLTDLEMGKMNVNFFPDLARDFSIESVPCLIFIKNGQPEETIYAFHSVPYLMDKMNSIYQKTGA